MTLPPSRPRLSVVTVHHLGPALAVDRGLMAATVPGSTLARTRRGGRSSSQAAGTGADAHRAKPAVIAAGRPARRPEACIPTCPRLMLGADPPRPIGDRVLARAPLAERLAALDQLDRAGRAAALQREARAMLGRPNEAAALMREVVASPEGDGLKTALDLAAFVLDEARMACENDQPSGRAVIEAVEGVLAEARAAGRLPPARRVALARAFVGAGLAVPIAARIDPDEALDGMALPGGPPPDLDGLLDDLLGRADPRATSLQLHASLEEVLGALPVEARAMMMAEIAGGADARRTRLGLYGLLDLEPGVRAAVARAFAARASGGRLDAATLSQLAAIRAWLPDEPARAALDRALAAAMRRGGGDGAEADPAPPPWRVRRALACLPDGAGAQSVALALDRGRSRAAAFLLLKAGHGVKDAFIAPAEDAAEQRRMLESLEAMGAVELDPARVPRLLERALGDGTAHGRPPAPGLLDVAELWPGTALRPQPGDARAILAELDPEGAIVALSPQARGRLVGESADWPERFALVETWFEDTAAVRALLDAATTERAARQRVWRHLEERRGWWALQCARSAAVLRAAEPEGRDWRAFAAVALGLLEGRALRRTPIIGRVLEATLFADAARGQDAALGALDGLGDLGDDPDLDGHDPFVGTLRPPPAPARPGELERRLAGSSVDPAWVDGLATAAAVSPEPASPLGWIMGVIQAVEHRDEAALERFLELLTLRADAAVEAVASPAATAGRLAALDAGGRARWAQGFVEHVAGVPEAWPWAALGAEDRRMLEALETASRAGMDERLRRALPAWLAARAPR